MTCVARCLLLFAVAVVWPTAAMAQPDAKAEKKPAPKMLSTEDLADRARASVVVVRFTGRERQQVGLGTGFVVSSDGLIATNLHVIGEARPISVTFADGKRFDVKTVHATEKAMDLALLKIDAKGLPALALADSDQVKQGQSVVAIGNPLGLKHSVVEGIVSGTRELEGKPMIQLAIPVEEGNSGGPVLDRQGRVIGIMTLKHRLTDNLGFAVAINALKPLIAKPNPIPIARWLTIGTLDEQAWTVHYGARWRQRAGRIQVSGRGTGFGGRAVCYSKRAVPKLPYEVQVSLRLAEDDGAAGLIFCGDGRDKHYGFYPSSGQMRLTRFAGPDVTSWTIFETKATPHYRPGEWNTIKVRLTKDRIRCFVNDQLVIESTDASFRAGPIGLAKFRHTTVDFRGFRVGRQLPPSSPSAETVTRITGLVENLPTRGAPNSALVEKLVPDADAGLAVLRDRARLLEQQVLALRELALAVHRQRVGNALAAAMKQPEEKIDLLRAALMIAWLDNDEVEVEAYVEQFGRMAAALSKSLPKDADEAARMKALDEHFHGTLLFHGSRVDYYNRSNSYLNEVLDDREGLPISLSVLYIELGRRIGLKVVGVGLPGHFIVRHEPNKGVPQLIDVFDGGRRITRDEAVRRISENLNPPRPTGDELKAIVDDFLKPTPRRTILVRMLTNLSNSAARRRDAEAMGRYADVILAADPDNLSQRGLRIQLAMTAARYDQAIRDIDWLLEHKPEQVRVPQLQLLRRQLVESRDNPR